MTIRLALDVLEVAKIRARSENRTLTNYIETLIRKDIAGSGTAGPLDGRADAPLSVFVAEPLAGRLTTDVRDGDTPEDVAQRQEYLDIITGWNRDR